MAKLSNSVLKLLLEDLLRLRKEPEISDPTDVLTRALGSGSPHAQAKAVALINDRKIAGFDAKLVQLYGKAFVNPAKADAGWNVSPPDPPCAPPVPYGD